jgi:tetratricopeptide (TPR) repeat protein
MLEENNLEEAEKSFRYSLEIDERLGDKVNAASSLHELGRCLWKQRQYKPAEFLLKKALANLDTNQPTDLNKKKLSVFVLS